VSATTNDTRRAVPDPTVGYAPGERRPLAAYAVLTGAFFAALGGSLVAARARGRDIDRPGALDVALHGLAIQKVSRLIAKDKVMSFVRAPFTRFQEASGQGELEEAPRGDGLRYAVGELLVCPYCVAQWVAGGIAVGHIFAPKTTRFLSSMWAAQGIADGVQLAYSAGETQT
jgi:Protein of unknown function (DUF1360)